MLTNVRLENFRSVFEDRFSLPTSGLGVLIGANGSGKSNVVRAFEFIASLHNSDVFDAIASQGGSFSIVPKAIPEIRGTQTNIDYSIPLPTSEAYPSQVERPVGTHSITVRWTSPNDFKIVSETLTFSNPLAKGLELRRNRDGASPDETDVAFPLSRNYEQSQIVFTRSDEGNIGIEASPQFSQETLPLYIEWLGLGFMTPLGVDLETGKDLRAFLNRAGNQIIEQRGYLLESQDSMLALGTQAPFGFSEPVSYFTSVAQAVKRFDLQVAELRSEQQMSKTGEMTSEGDNLPSVVRWLRRGGAKLDEWKRVKATLRDIAPFVRDIRNRSLRTGKEYVRFDETEGGREVESWDSSDGTLRALAMLVAVETHPAHGTIIIEEPEQALHPWAIESLISHIRTVIKEKALQVILTTHSQQVLKQVDPNEVLVTSRTKEAGTNLRPATESVDVESPTADDLGRLWVKGLLGGIPKY